MANHIYAAIRISSNELTMKIYEISKKHGITELTHVTRHLPLGSETYLKGYVSYRSTTEICSTLNDFIRIMDEFGVESSDVYATSGIREAKNRLVLIDQIRIQTGFRIKVLSNSEARFLFYKALSVMEERFEHRIKDGTIVADVGAGTLQLSIFDHGMLLSTQNLMLGASRIQELLQVMEEDTYEYLSLVDEYIEKDITSFIKFNIGDTKIKYIMAVGGMVPAAYYYMQRREMDFSGFVRRKMITDLKLPDDVTPENAGLVMPTILILRKISEITDCTEFILSPVDLCDAMATQYMEKRLKVKPKHNFDEDILYAARTMAIKYRVDRMHVETVETLALQIFDRIRKLHGLGNREKLLLRIAVILHGCGAFINENHSRDNSYHIIKSTEIIGISDVEREIIANVVRYNDDDFPPYEDFGEYFKKDEYITIVKLNAILKTANVLDKSNRHKIKSVDVSLEDGILTIVADTMADITLEKGLFHDKADVFEEVFGIRPKLIQKRTGKIQ